MRRIKNLDIKEISFRQIRDLNQAQFTTTKHLQYCLEPDDCKKLKKIAIDLDTSVSEMVRSAVVQFVEQYSDDNAEKYIFKKED